MSATYRVHTYADIRINFETLTCPACGANRGLCLTTSGDGQPVTGSCPDGHFWDEHRLTGSEVKDTAIDLDQEPR
jgi:hypothetical protein